MQQFIKVRNENKEWVHKLNKQNIMMSF